MKSFTTVDHPQANEQVEAVNKIIKQILKTRLETKKRAWVDKLQKVLWFYRITARSTTGETLFSMVYGSEAIISAEYEVTSQWRATFNLEGNDWMLITNLDLLEEARESACIRYYNRKVQVRRYKPGDLVLRLVLPRARKVSDETLDPN